MSSFIVHVKSWWSAYGAAVLGFVTVVYPIFVGHHPSVAGGIGAVGTFLAGLSKSPLAKS